MRVSRHIFFLAVAISFVACSEKSFHENGGEEGEKTAVLHTFKDMDRSPVTPGSHIGYELGSVLQPIHRYSQTLESGRLTLGSGIPANQRYASYFLQWHWASKYGVAEIGRLWRESKKPEDAIQTYQRVHGLSMDELNADLYDYAARCVTWDFSAEATGATLSSFSLREALRATRDAEFKLMDGPDEVPLCVLGDHALFACPIPAQTVKTCWLYVRLRPVRRSSERYRL